MANKILAVVKKHPKKTALFVGVGLVAVFFVSRAKGTEVDPAGQGFAYGTGQYTSEMMAVGLQMAQLQAGATAQTNQLNAGLAAIDATNSHVLELAQLEANTTALGISTAYNIALLESGERIHGLDTAADVQRQQNILMYNLGDKALNYENANAMAQNAILQSMADYGHTEMMTHLGTQQFLAEAQDRYAMGSLSTSERIAKMQTDATVKIAEFGFNAAANAAISDTMGGALASIFGSANLARMNDWANSANTGNSNPKYEKATAPGTNNQSSSGAGSNKKGGGG